MSKRPIRDKKMNRLRKLLRTPPYTSIDLVDYLQTRGYVNTAGKARQWLEDGRVTHESHIIGRQRLRILVAGEEQERWVADPLVPASYRGNLYVRTS